MKESGLDGVVIVHYPNIRYLCGFTGSAGVLWVGRRGATLFTDSRYTLQAEEEVTGAKVRSARRDPLDAVGKGLEGLRQARVGYEASRVSVAAQRRLERAAGRAIQWRRLENCVEQFRSTKDAQEIAQMRSAALLGSLVFSEVLPWVRPGVREVELAAELDYQMRSHGAEGPAFETIVASGRRSALPHARPTTKPLRKNELVVLDWGAIVDGYCCDLTRTVYLGRAPAKIRRWYEAVREAQAAAREALRDGVAAEEVDAAARRSLQRQGLSRYFVHSTGHGLGLEVHEEPRLAKGRKEALRSGNVVTLEPGVYVEGIGGIRLEDDAVVTSDGAELLTTATREFLQL